jgi:IS5 family transposase
VYVNSAYASKAPEAKELANEQVRMRGEVNEVRQAKNRNKSKVRARVEHVFGVFKRLWGFARFATKGWRKTPRGH